MTIKAVLFDLDGTLLDTAPDFAFALNQLLAAQHKAAIDIETLRPSVAYGTAAMLKFAFDMTEEHPEFNQLREQFLQLYFDNIAQFTMPFPGIIEIIELLNERNIIWGIVTNKPAWLTHALLSQITLPQIPHCVISGDTLPLRKPDPAPLLYACKQLNLAPEDCIYVGDAEIDVQAAKNAAMPILVAEYGYMGLDPNIKTWLADGYIQHPLDIQNWLK